MTRPPTQNERILALLADGKPHSFHEVLRHVPCVVHSRVAELRSRGHNIVCDKTGGDYRYRLVGGPLTDTPAPTDRAGVSVSGAAPAGPHPPVTGGTPDPSVAPRGGAAQLTLLGEHRREPWS